MSGRLWQALEEVAQRFRRVRLWGGLAACWLVLALAGLALARLGPSPGLAAIPPGWVPAALSLLAVLMGLACALAAIRTARDPRWVARRIESRHPDLGMELLAAVDEVEAAPGGRLGFLQATVVREALEHRRTHDWDETVPTWLLRSIKLAHAISLVFLIGVIGTLAFQSRSSAFGGPRGSWQADSSEVQVDPGDVELERGSPLLVVARFMDGAPSDATLALDGDVPGPPRRPMTRSLEDPTFAARVDSVQSDLSYRVEFEGRTTVSYRVKVFEYPELRRADAHLIFPSYTALEPKVVEDIRHVTAVEGTELTLICRLNKDVTSAALTEKGGQSIALERDDSQPHTYRARMTLTDPKKFTVKLVDAQGRSNPVEPEIVVNVTRNRPPTVTVTQPAHDVEVSPLEELNLKARMDDDFGLVRHGLSYAIGGGEPKEVVFASPKPAAGQPAPRPPLKLDAAHMIDFEAMKAMPDELVSYFFWAEDIGPDGQVRRASSDMFFAEVRPFEEIFRQGEQPPAGSAEMEGEQGNAQEAGQLAELQKQIVSGTWKVIRRETRAEPTETFNADANTLRESQKAVIDQAGQLGERLRDATSRASLQQALNAMRESEKHLRRAADESAIPALQPALTAEQTAYQALLRLRAREFQVTRSRSQRNRGRGGGGPNQRQLDQLELKPDENRFEEQRTARSQQNQTQREREQAENRQILNRLRELAQRQRDLNERLKELQSALEAAKTPEAKEDLQRQLKRLREQQQEMLRDTDELRERMESEQNQQRMAEARRQVEQGREHLRQASKALEEGRLPQALTEGARAGQQLNDLREQFRKETANRFSEEMTQLRSEARKLDEEQKKINQQLEAWEQKPERSLRESDERKQVRENAERQTKRLDQVLDRMRNTTQEAEDTEPLLAKGLYDAVRQANENKVPEALKATKQLVDAGIPEEASKAARHAGQGIEQLRQGVEKAAESVLGDETKALRRAQGELDDLADQVNREIARNQPKPGPQGRPGEARPDQQPPADPSDQLETTGVPREQGQAPGRPDRQGQRPGDRGQGQTKGQEDRAPDGQATPKGQRGQARSQENGQQGQGGEQADQQGQPGGDQQQGGSRPTPGPSDPQGRQGGERQQQGGQRGGRGGSRPNLDLEQVAQGMQNGPGGPHGPITGEGFRQWSDRMRDVEELLEDPEWRAEAARIRDRVRGAREEVRRHAKEPDWNKLQDLVTRPINELRQKVAEELRRRESPDALVPIDRDPVPPQFAEGVRRYYERLGSSR